MQAISGGPWLVTPADPGGDFPLFVNEDDKYAALLTVECTETDGEVVCTYHLAGKEANAPGQTVKLKPGQSFSVICKKAIISLGSGKRSCGSYMIEPLWYRERFNVDYQEL